MFRKLLLYFALLLWFVVPSQAQLTIMLPEMEVEPGETVDLEVKVVKEFNAIIGAQFSVEWNPDILEFVRIKEVNLTPFDLEDDGQVNTNFAMEGRVGIRWDDPSFQGVTIADSAALMILEMRVVGQANDADSLKFVNSPIAIEFGDFISGAYDTIGLHHGYITVKDVNTNTRIQQAGNLKLLPNEPNPFTNYTNLNFELIQSEDIRLNVYDLNGRVIWQREEFRTAGKHNIQLAGDELPAAGTYWLELRAGKHLLRQQLIHLK